MIQLPFDTGHLSLSIELKENVNILESAAEEYEPTDTQENLVRDALKKPIGSTQVRDLVQAKNNIVIITSDHTRPVPSHITLPILINEIKSANPNARITLLISTGMHRPTTEEEMLKKFGQKVLAQVTVVNHNSEKDEDMVFLGSLPSGGELWVNKIAIEADLLIGEGFIEPHFFAGFSGGRKSVLPGIASRKTVLFNHNAKFIASPFARTGILENNPIHHDMVWAAEQAKMAFILNVVINAKKEIIYCVAGHPVEAHKAGCDFLKKLTAT
ncbi:MAG: nickel-dependent lactate racemase, partial [Bacillota bacterium]|nr:nickel-dependent lactate racemase [Bacillota bacterium]